ncbi:MAG: phosphatase [Candidatus Tectimicrobiota bacterium]|nr:MAG: phosphatase [Candidatus Tectomicrobia bacterium]
MRPGRGWPWLQTASLVLTRAYWGLVLALNWWDVIDEHLLLGGLPMFDDLERLQQQGVGAVVNLCAERPHDHQHLRRAGLDALWLPVPNALPPTPAQLHDALTWMADQLAAGRAVYVHCAAGIGRSATLLACWYVATQGWSPSQALAYLKRRRPQVAPTRRQRRALADFAARLPQPPALLSLPPSWQVA